MPALTVAGLVEALTRLPQDLPVGKLLFHHAKFQGRGGTELRFFPVTMATEERAHKHVVLVFGAGEAVGGEDEEDA